MKANTENIPFSQQNFLEIVLRRKWMILLLVVTIVTTCMVGTLRMTPVYETTAKISLEKDLDQEKQVLFDLPSIRQDAFDYVASEIEVIKSRPLVEKVVRELELHRLKTEPTTLSEEDRFQIAVNSLLNKLDVQKIKNTNVITIKLESENPDRVARIINKLVDVYKAYRNEDLDESETLSRLNQQISDYKSKINQLTSRSAWLKKNWEMHSAPLKADVLQQNLVKHQQLLTEVQNRYDAKLARLQNIEQQVARGEDVALPSLDAEASPNLENHISRLKEQLLQLDIEIKEMLQTYTLQNKKVTTLLEKKDFLKKNYEEAVRQFIAQEKVEINVLEEQIKKLESNCRSILHEIAALSLPERELDKIDADLENTREIYSMLVKEREVNRISDSKKEKKLKIRMISPAYRPLSPVKPNKRVNAILSVILGLIIGMGTAFGVEYLHYSRQQISTKKKSAENEKRKPELTREDRSMPDINFLKNANSFDRAARRYHQLVGGFAFLGSILGILIFFLIGARVKEDNGLINGNPGASDTTIQRQEHTSKFDDSNLERISVRNRDTIYRILMRKYKIVTHELILAVEEANPNIQILQALKPGDIIRLPEFSSSDKPFTVHIFSYRSFDIAVREFNKWQNRGYDVVLHSIDLNYRGTFYRISLERFESESDAQRFRREIMNRFGLNYARVVELNF